MFERFKKKNLKNIENGKLFSQNLLYIIHMVFNDRFN